MRGCDGVVHLARGDRRVMRQGLAHVLGAAARANVRRFIHLSSVAVYGNHPPPESVAESAPVRQCDNLYGQEKLRQERLVLKYARHGLPAVILRPPAVYGPFSSFALAVLERIRAGTVAVGNGGAAPSHLGYLGNLVHAILLALAKPEAEGPIFFVRDDDGVTSGNCLGDYARRVGAQLPP